MAHFAKLDTNNIVTSVEKVENAVITINDEEIENIGIDFLIQHSGHTAWKQTWFTGGKRINFAGIGYFYDENNDVFIAPKPFNSWILDETTYKWVAPIPMPQDELRHIWIEEELRWE